MHVIPEEISPSEGHLTDDLNESLKRSTMVNINLFLNVHMVNTHVKLQHDTVIFR